MTKTELDSYQQLLNSLYDRLNGDVSHLAEEALHTDGREANSNLSNMPIHMADLGTYEREFTLGLLENEEQTLGEIAAAIGRIEQGTFGHCEGCRKAIPKDRLHALPYARYCFECAGGLQG